MFRVACYILACMQRRALCDEVRKRREEPRRTPMGPRREGPRRIPMGQKRDLAAHARGRTQMKRATIMARKWTTFSTLSRRRE